MKESETVFDAFNAKHNAQTTQPSNSSVTDSPPKKKTGGDPQPSKKAGGQQKKKKDTSKKNEKGFDSLVEALKALDPKELKAELNDVQSRCPDAPSVGGRALDPRIRKGLGWFLSLYEYISFWLCNQGILKSTNPLGL